MSTIWHRFINGNATARKPSVLGEESASQDRDSPISKWALSTSSARHPKRSKTAKSMQLIRVIPINGEYFFDPWLMAPLFDDVFGQGNWKLEQDFDCYLLYANRDLTEAELTRLRKVTVRNRIIPIAEPMAAHQRNKMVSGNDAKDNDSSMPIHLTVESGNKPVNRAMAALAVETADRFCSEFLSKLRERLDKLEKEEQPADSKGVPPASQAKKELSTFARMNLAGFSQLSPQKVEGTAAKAAAKVQTVASKYNIEPTAVTKAARLAFYNFILLCDGSSSMRYDTRILTLQISVRELFGVARLLNTDTRFAVYTFAGPGWENLETESEMEMALSTMTFDTGESAPGPLNERVLQPLRQLAVQKKLDPTVVVVITDRDIDPVTTFSQTIADFKSQLNDLNYTGPAVLFLVCRVGNDAHAARSLSRLKTNNAIKDIVFYSEDSLDLKLQQMNGNTDAYVGMVITDLIKAMELQIEKT